jgi:hypothetical protein
VIRPGDVAVTGTATGREGPEPVAVQSVTVNGTAAALTRTPGSVTVGFTATVPMPAWVPTATITAAAVDELGFRAGASVTVRMGGGWIGSWSELYSDNDYLYMLDVALNADGRLEVVGTNQQGGGTVWHTWQTQPNGAWAGSWSELYTDNDNLYMLAVGRNADGRLEVFGANLSGHILHTWQTQASNGWAGSWSELYTDNILGMLAVGRNADGRLEVFGANRSSNIWHTWQTQANNGWAGSWSELDSPNVYMLRVASNADGRLELVVLDEGGKIWHTWQTQPNGAWVGSWSELVSSAFMQPGGISVVSNADGRLEVFGLALLTKPGYVAIVHTSQVEPNGPWGGSWSQLPLMTDSLGDPISVFTFAAAQNGDGRLELVAMAADSSMWHIRQTEPGTWDGATWNKFYGGNDNLGDLYMARNADGRLEVFGIKPTKSAGAGSIWHTWRDWGVPFEATTTGTVPS